MQKNNNNSLKIFGFIWAAIFLIIALFPIKNGSEVRSWSLCVAVGFTLISLIYPVFYQKIYFYQGWIKFGNFIGHINSKIIIFILFYFLFLPIGILLKVFRKDLLGKSINESAKSYFIDRKEQPTNMENQF